MPGETEVINAALRLIGASPVVSLEDGSTAANAAADLYPELRDGMLRAHPWAFATKRQKLAQSATAPVFGFDYAYPVPADWLRTISVHDNDNEAGAIVYREEQSADTRVIVTNTDECWMLYIARVTNPNMMSADFRRALENALARDLAVPIASSNTLQDTYERRAERLLARARSADGMGSFPKSRPQGSWVTSRGGWGGRGAY